MELNSLQVPTEAAGVKGRAVQGGHNPEKLLRGVGAVSDEGRSPGGLETISSLGRRQLPALLSLQCLFSHFK